MSIRCSIGVHAYENVFEPFADQPYQTNGAEDELCCLEGTWRTLCVRCGIEEPKKASAEKDD